MKNRRISKAAVRPGCGLRFHETKQRKATATKAMMPSQRVKGVGLRWSNGVRGRVFLLI